MRWAGNVARIGEKRGVYRNLLGKPEGKRPHGRSGRKGRIILRRIFRWVDVDWIELVQNKDRWRALVKR